MLKGRCQPQLVVQPPPSPVPLNKPSPSSLLRGAIYFLLPGMCIEICWYRNGFDRIILFASYSYWQGIECKPRKASAYRKQLPPLDLLPGHLNRRRTNPAEQTTALPSSLHPPPLSVLLPITTYSSHSLFIYRLIFFHVFHSTFLSLSRSLYFLHSPFAYFSFFLSFKFCSQNVLHFAGYFAMFSMSSDV